MRIGRSLAAAALATATLLAVTGCGSALNAAGTTTGQSPKRAAENGVTALLDHDALTATMTLDADPVTLDAVFQADTDSPLPRGVAGQLAGATVVIAATTGGGSFRDLGGRDAPSKDASYSLTLNTRATPNLVQVVATPTTLYFRADLEQLLGLLGGDSGPIAGLLTGPNLPGPLKDAVTGHWVAIDLASLTGQAGGSALPSVGPSRAAAFAGSLDAIFHKDVTVVRAAPDPKLGDHLVLSGNIRTIGTDLLTSLEGFLGSVPGASDLVGSQSPSLPAKTITVDEYVKNGTASAFRVDLTQLLDPAELKAAAGRSAVLDVDLAPTATITTPSDATPLSTSDLAGIFGALFGSVTQTDGVATAVPVPPPSSGP